MMVASKEKVEEMANKIIKLLQENHIWDNESGDKMNQERKMRLSQMKLVVVVIVIAATCSLVNVSYGATIMPENGTISLRTPDNGTATLRAPPGSVIKNFTVVPLPDSDSSPSGPETWNLSLSVTDIPEYVPQISFMIYKGSGLQAEQLSSLLVDIGKGTASTFVVVESSDIGDHDTYSVCYTAQFGKNQSAHQYCSGPLTHHGENHNITLSASYGDILS